MIVFVGALLVLCIIAFAILKQVETSTVIKNLHFEKLQNQYLYVYYLAVFSDWLQGPYVYKLYSDYGYDEDDIAILYIIGFASSSVFGTMVGCIADKYGRKVLCTCYGILYTICCLTKLSSKFNILLIGRIFGGISTSILFSTFEAWYVNEHLNYFQLSPDLMNNTFGKAAFYTGLLAIIAGISSQFFAEILQLGSVSPFLLAVPFLLLSTYMVMTTWTEHKPIEEEKKHHSMLFSALKLILCKELILLNLGLIQSLFESVMYIFIFLWTPILIRLEPPIGLVFSIFMVAFMIGTKTYTLLIFKRYRPQNLLILTNSTALISFLIGTMFLTVSVYATDKTENLSSYNSFFKSHIPTYVCFFSFVFYEFSVGIYFPAMGYLRGRVIPETYRASVANWFRVPMNVFTCLGLLLKQNSTNYDKTVVVQPHISYKFPTMFLICSIFLIISTILATIFGNQYTKKIIKIDLETKLKTDETKEDNQKVIK